MQKKKKTEKKRTTETETEIKVKSILYQLILQLKSLHFISSIISFNC